MSILKEKLLSKDYYKDQLTYLLQNSYGVPEQIDTFVEVLNNMDSTITDFFNLLGYNNEDFSFPLDKDTIISSTKDFDLLNKIAKIVGGQRNLSLTYETRSGEYKVKTITLTNEELYCVVYSNIVRNNFTGTKKEITDYYANLKTLSNGALDIKYYTKKENPLSVYLSMNSSNSVLDGDKMNNYEILFLNEYFTIKSMGVAYIHKLFDFSNDIPKWNQVKWNQFKWF